MPRAPQTIIDIDLTGTPYKEFEVQVASATLGQMLALGDQPDRLRAGAGLSAVRELVELFAEKIRYWNVDGDDDKPLPLPATADTLLGLDFRFSGMLIKGWLEGMTSVDEDLGKGSNSGAPSVPPNFPMEAL